MKPTLTEIRAVFMGSPDFALPALQALADHTQVVGIVTQPDRPAGRGSQLRPPPVKALSQRLGIPVIQPERLKQPEAMQQLQEWTPDVIIVAAFGQILRPAVLDLPRYGCINIHASLLPRWRGAAPIQAAIWNGDAVTGATIMRMDPGLDTGPVYSQDVIPIRPEDTAGTLSEKLAHSGAKLLIETLPGIISGEIKPVPQDDSRATYAPKLEKSAGMLDLTLTAHELANQIRALNPWPGASLPFREGILKVHRARVLPGDAPEPATRSVIDGLPAIATGKGWLQLLEVQLPGKPAYPGDVFLRGARDW